VLEKEAPVVVYSFDKKCDASLRAARTKEELGYQDVYHYDAGKRDWKEGGFPIDAAEL
jgi:hypothetical protein